MIPCSKKPIASPLPWPVDFSGFMDSFLTSLLEILSSLARERIDVTGMTDFDFDGEVNCGRGTENMSVV
jgi:hypothetical protein